MAAGPLSRTPPEALRSVRELTFDREVFAVDWSPDGARLAVGGSAGVVEVLTSEGRRLWRRREGRGGVFDLRWSPSGLRLASASADGAVRIWNPALKLSVRVSQQAAHRSPVLDWSPDLQRLACAADTVIILYGVTGWQAAGGTTIRGQKASSIGWSPDGSYLAVGYESGKIRLRDDRTNRDLGLLEGHEHWVRRLAWAPDSRHLASACVDGTARIWNVEDRQCVLVLEGHRGPVESVSWSPDGSFLATGSDDGTVRIWDADAGGEIARIDGHTRPVLTVAFSPDGTCLASASRDRSVRIWDATGLGALRSGRAVGASLEDYAARQATTVGRRARRKAPLLWVPRLPPAEGDVLGEFRGTGGQSGSVDIFPDSRSLIIGGGVHSLRRVELATGSSVWRIAKIHDQELNDVKLSPDGRWVASASEASTVKIHDPETGRTISSFSQSSGSLRSVAWSPDSKLVATAGIGDWMIRTWNVETSRFIALCESFEFGFRYVDWSADGQFLASAGYQGSLQVWRPVDGVEIGRPELHAGGIRTVRWASSKTLLAAGAFDGTVLVWEPGTLSARVRCEGHAASINCLAWSPDGRLLASGGNGKTIRIWDSETGQELCCFPFAERYAWRLAWAPNGAFLAASLEDDVVRLWDVRSLLRPQTRLHSATPRQRELTGDLEPLPEAFAHLTRLGLPLPLSDLRILLRLVGGGTAIEPLKSHPGIRELVALRWPAASRLGLVAVLLKDVPREDRWTPPLDANPTELRDALAEALTGEPIAPDAPPLPVAAITQAADAIDDRLLTLLELVGPDAVAADPGLPLRLLPRASKLPALAAPRRRLLGLRLRLDRGGPAHGHGAGAERTGIDVRGDWRSLLPWQLALPEAVLRGRYVRHEMLYRARSGEEPPRLRPTVLVLDVSPPTFGPVERATRLAAHVIASSLLEAGLPLVLVTAGGSGSVRTLERPSDLVELWTSRSPEGANEVGALRLARAMRETLAGDELAPVVVLLSHVFFGADEDAIPEVPGLRGFFIQYPGRTVRPPLAEACERWQCVRADELDGLEERLGRLVG